MSKKSSTILLLGLLTWHCLKRRSQSRRRSVCMQNLKQNQDHTTMAFTNPLRALMLQVLPWLPQAKEAKMVSTSIEQVQHLPAASHALATLSLVLDSTLYNQLSKPTTLHWCPTELYKALLHLFSCGHPTPWYRKSPSLLQCRRFSCHLHELLLGVHAVCNVLMQL